MGDIPNEDGSTMGDIPKRNGRRIWAISRTQNREKGAFMAVHDALRAGDRVVGVVCLARAIALKRTCAAAFRSGGIDIGISIS